MLGPNIIGEWKTEQSNSPATFTGAYYKVAQRGYEGGGNITTNTKSLSVPYFQASRSNAIYGKSSTVQPASITTLILIKT